MSWGEWLVANGEALQFPVYFFLLAVLAGAELVKPHRAGPMQRALRWRTNFALTLFYVVALGAAPIGFIGTAFWARAHGVGLLNLASVPAGVDVAITLLARAFISFITHYLHHMVPILWRVHRVHHLDTELDVSTTVRIHPLELATGLAIGIPIVAAIGPAPSVLIAYELLDVVVTLWSHSNTRVPAWLERILCRIVVTPELHRVHHSAWKPETNSNFGAVFPVWDMVCGTYRRNTRVPTAVMPLGLTEAQDESAHQLLPLLALRGLDSSRAVATGAGPRDGEAGRSPRSPAAAPVPKTPR